MPTLPEGTRYGTLTWQVIRAVGDTAQDPDRDPDATVIAGLTAVFTPTVSVMKDATVPVTIFANPITATFDAQGHMVGEDGQQGIRLIATDSPNLQPQGVQYKVVLSAPTISSQTLMVEVWADQTTDLTNAVIPSVGNRTRFATVIPSADPTLLPASTQEGDLVLAQDTSQLYQLTDATLIPIVSLRGEKGEKGDKGDTGDTGDVTPEAAQVLADAVAAQGQAEVARQGAETALAGVPSAVEGALDTQVEAAQSAASAAQTSAASAASNATSASAAAETATTMAGQTVTLQDEAVESLVADSATRTGAALRSITYADRGGLYLPTPYADLVWRTRRAEVLAGQRQGHIAVMGDSRSFGAAATGTSSPKYLSSYPGRLREMLAARYGPSGTGWVILDNNIFATPAYDDRLTVAGTDTVEMGWHAASARRLVAASAGTLTFTAECEEFWIFNLQSNGGLNNASVDGAAAQTFRNITTGSTPALAMETGYHPKHIVTRVPAGTLGEHTMAITTNGTNNIVLAAVEGRIPTPGTFRVSNPSINGKSLSTFLAKQANGESSGLWGLPMIDALRADLLLIALGINDWQGQTAVETVKTRLTTIIQRQRLVGASPSGGAAPGGDAMLVWLPKPNVEALVPGAPIPWEAYRDAYYEVADEQNIALIDLGLRWKDYATANALGLFGDTIHENDMGSLDVAAGLLAPLGL